MRPPLRAPLYLARSNDLGGGHAARLLSPVSVLHPPDALARGMAYKAGVWPIPGLCGVLGAEDMRTPSNSVQVRAASSGHRVATLRFDSRDPSIRTQRCCSAAGAPAASAAVAAASLPFLVAAPQRRCAAPSVSCDSAGRFRPNAVFSYFYRGTAYARQPPLSQPQAAQSAEVGGKLACAPPTPCDWLC